MPDYGVTDTGFERPEASELKAKYQAIITEAWNLPDDFVFADGCPETAFCDMLVSADIDLWEMAEGVYNGYSDCTATGCQVDMRAKEKGLIRLAGESAIELRQRMKTDQEKSSLQSQLENVDGVDCVRIYNYQGPEDIDPITGNPLGSQEVVIYGDGYDEALVAEIIFECSDGCIKVGQKEVEYDDGDICHIVKYTCAEARHMCVKVLVNTVNSSCDCSSQNEDAILDEAFAALNEKGVCGRSIGDPLSGIRIGAGIMTAIKGIEVSQVLFAEAGLDADGKCTCDGVDINQGAIDLGPYWFPVYDRDCICVVFL